MTEQYDTRGAALQRLKAKRAFFAHLATYSAVNAFLVIVWVTSDAANFWPGWALLGWGVGLMLHGWSAFLRKPISEDEMHREMRRIN